MALKREERRKKERKGRKKGRKESLRRSGLLCMRHWFSLLGPETNPSLLQTFGTSGLTVHGAHELAFSKRSG